MSVKTRFSLSENPQKPGCRHEGGAGLFIVQHINPVAIIECDLAATVPLSDKCRAFVYVNNNGFRETWYLTLHFCFQAIGEEDISVPKLLTRAWHWYAAYLKWEDGNIDIDDYSHNN